MTFHFQRICLCHLLLACILKLSAVVFLVVGKCYIMLKPRRTQKLLLRTEPCLALKPNTRLLNAENKK